MLSTIRSKTLVTTGFIALLSLFAVFTLVWIKNLSANRTFVSQLVEQQLSKSDIILIQLLALQAQTHLQTLRTGATLESQTKAYNDWLALTMQLRQALDSVKTKTQSAQAHALIGTVQEYLDKAAMLASQVASALAAASVEARSAKSLSGEPSSEEPVPGEVFKEFLSTIDPAQQKLLAQLSEQLEPQSFLQFRQTIRDIQQAFDAEHYNSKVVIVLLGFSGFLLSLFTIFVSHRTGKTEAQLVDQGQRIRALYEITARPDLSLDEQITETLRLGCRLLNMEIGKVGQQNPENNTSTFLNTVAPPDLPARRGIVLPLDKTFCSITFSSPGPIALHHVSQSQYRSHPAASFIGMQAYIGTTIRVGGKKFGTVNFSHRKPRATPFTETDKDLVNLIGSWISVTLEKQISEEELKKSKESAEQANRAKSEFLANMSHEIRIFLTAILGYSDMLRDEDQSAEDINHEIDSIIRSGAHLQRIINDILDLSKIEAGQLVIEELRLEPAKILLDMESILGSKAREKGLAFNVAYDFPFPREIISDPTRLKQILFNLCGNAIKFTTQGSIDVRLGYMEETRQIKFTIQDSGIGMSHEELKRLFKPFSQADTSTTRMYGGTGLGLCISQQLAQRLNGSIEVSSEKNKGSLFVVKLGIGRIDNTDFVRSASEIESAVTEETFTIVPNSLRGHVLIVEDSPDNQDLISRYIFKAGATVEIVDNGLLAVKRAFTKDFDLILMDIQMPVMDGLQATKKLRDAGYTKPIVSITANALKEDRDKCLAAGADDYLTKPINPEHFYQVLQRYLRPYTLKALNKAG